jgi:hypothetical protein
VHNHLDLGAGRSTLDAIGQWYTLFTERPTDRAEQSGPWPVRVEHLADGHETVLVRPDSYIADVRTADRA